MQFRSRKPSRLSDQRRNSNRPNYCVVLIFLQSCKRHCYLQGMVNKHLVEGLDDLSGTSVPARVCFEALS
jgi:hypothetical protein